MTPEQKARESIDRRLVQAGWVIQDYRQLNPMASFGVAVREFPTSSGPVDYALFVDGKPVGIVEAKRDDNAEGLTEAEGQSARYAKSHFLHCNIVYQIRFAYEATGKVTRFTDYADADYSSREVFSFHRPETLNALLTAQQKGYDTLRNNMKRFPAFDTTGFRKCQIAAIQGLENSFAMKKPRALIQMATGAGKTFTAITAAYRLLKYARMKRILFLVDTRSLGKQADEEFRAYRPNDDNRSFSEIYNVCRLNSAFIPEGSQVCISTIQRMYSILKGEPLDERAEDPLRIAFDDIHLKDVYCEAVRTAHRHGIREISNYILFNYKDKPEDLYERLRVNIELNEELGIQIFSFPMKYSPISETDRTYIGANWCKKSIRAISAILQVTKGVVAAGSSFFYKAFGNNLEEFYEILAMPRELIMFRSHFEGDGTTAKWQALYRKLNDEQKDRLMEIVSHNMSELRNIPWPDDLREILEFYLIKYSGKTEHTEEQYVQMSLMDDSDIVTEDTMLD